MEHRLYTRRPAKYLARLVIEGCVVATTEVINMSLCGLGVKRPNIALKRGQTIEVRLIKPGYPRATSRCFASTVARTGINTLGLMLACDSELHMMLPEHSVTPNDLAKTHHKPSTQLQPSL